MESDPAAQSPTSALTPFQKFKLWLFGLVGYIGIAIIGKTMRWQTVGDEHFQSIRNAGHPFILNFWHDGIFSATYHWRNRGIIVLTSQNLDGEVITQCIRRFGYGASRGSSSRGGFRALAQLVRDVRGGKDAAITVDGPRGPRYVAKPGSILLASKSGAGILCFHTSLKHKIQLRNWDKFQIPIPFTRALVAQAEPIWVPRDATEEDQAQLLVKVQQTLDDLRIQGDEWCKLKG